MKVMASEMRQWLDEFLEENGDHPIYLESSDGLCREPGILFTTVGENGTFITQQEDGEKAYVIQEW